MTITSNIPDLIKQLETLKEQSANIDFSSALAAGVNAAMGEMKYRIFNLGLDKDKQSLGTYTGKQTRITSRKFTGVNDDIFDSETRRLLGKKKKRLQKNIEFFDADIGYSEYEKERLSEGRQIRYKDLEFHGVLRRSIVVAVISANKVSCIINNDTENNIAGYQEDQIGRIRGTGKASIFGINNDEQITLRTVGNDAIKQIISDRLHTT